MFLLNADVGPLNWFKWLRPSVKCKEYISFLILTKVDYKSLRQKLGLLINKLCTPYTIQQCEQLLEHVVATAQQEPDTTRNIILRV